MANTSRPSGFRPVKHTNGSPFNGQVNQYAILAADGTAAFVGDLVKLTGTASADGYPSVAVCAAGNTPVGVIVGFRPDPAALNTPLYRVASTLRYALVADSPDLVMEAQEDAVGGALAITNIGQNVDIIATAGSTTTGLSAMQVDSSTAATTSTLVLRLVGFVDRPDNEVGSANAKVLVAYNVHQYGSVGTTGV
jgi:hypothetical protein